MVDPRLLPPTTNQRHWIRHGSRSQLPVKVSVTGSHTATAVELVVNSETGSADAVPAKENARADANRTAVNPLTWVARRFMVFAYLFFEEPNLASRKKRRKERDSPSVKFS